jgi:AcrR family transcriptional regulator
MKQEIVKISLSRFLTYGIRKMTIQKLLSPLGISSKTVYKYFQNKEDLLRECLILHYARLLGDIIQTIESHPNPVQALVNSWNLIIEADFGVTRIFYHDLNSYYPALQDEILNKYFDRISEAAVNLLQRGMQNGYFRKELNPIVSYIAMNVLYSSITRTDHYKKLRISPEILTEQTLFVYLRGICTEKGLKEFNSIMGQKS